MGAIEQTEIDRFIHPRVNSADPVPPRPRPATPAHVIRDDAEALDIARRLAAEFAPGAALRDREGLLPVQDSTSIPRAASGRSTCPRPTVARVCRTPRWRR